MGEQEPTNDSADDITGRERDVDIEGLDFGKASSLEEDNGVAENRITAKDLCGPNNTVLNQSQPIFPAR